MIRDRPIYRKRNEIFYSIKNDLNFISVKNENLFTDTEIIKGKLKTVDIISREFLCSKKEFETAFKKALKAIKN